MANGEHDQREQTYRKCGIGNCCMRAIESSEFCAGHTAAHPSDIRQLPAVEQRVESGPVAFGDDWPGVFLRGDSAAFFAMHLDAFLNHPEYTGELHQIVTQQAVYGLLCTLQSCDLTRRVQEGEDNA